MEYRKVAKHAPLCALLTLVAFSPSQADEIWQTFAGRTTLTFDISGLAGEGVTLKANNGEVSVSGGSGSAGGVFLFADGSNLEVAVRDGSAVGFIGGELLHLGGLTFAGPKGDVKLQDFMITLAPAGSEAAFTAVEMAGDTVGLLIGGIKAGIDPAAGAFALFGEEVRLTPAAARALGAPKLAGSSIGTMMVEAAAQWVGGDPTTVFGDADPADQDPIRGGNPQTCEAGEAPDVIVGDLHEVGNYGGVGGIHAYSVGTISCNPGTCWLNWFQNTNQHPVIPQNMYRLKTVDNATRFEQVGQSWLKHGFFALSGSLCFSDCQSTNGEHLGVHCSDPYSASLNGQQSNLGPRSQVNASTGAFPYPFSAPPPPATIGRRLQVHDTDLDPALNSGALYFVEGHYITPDDAAAGNDNNNASYRRIVVGAAPNFNISFAGGAPPNATRRERSGIRAWKENGLGAGVADPAVEERDIQVPGDGLFILAAKATNLGNGFHRFEYAVQNLNSHRSAQSFTVPIPPGSTVVNQGFHDVDSHSGEPYDLTDWTITIGSNTITWSTQAFDVNQNANALRWGTLYNFRFDINALPAQNNVALGLFRPGTPTEMLVSVVAPPSGPPDCNGNGIGDPTDIAGGTSQDCDGNGTPDECQLSGNDCNNDGIPDNCQLGSNDCDADHTPDDCQGDCDGDGTADACEIAGGAPDCDANGVPDDCQSDCDNDGTPDICELGIVLFQDDFETDQGWTVQSDSPIGGAWARSDPVQTVYNANVVQPEFDNPTGTGAMCYVTDGSGPVTSSSDVDSGPTRLTSPSLDLSAGASTISYAYWFHTVLGTRDVMMLQVSNNDGATWVTMQTHSESASVWRYHSAVVDDYITRTATMRFRFVISDVPNDSYTEGLIDDVVVTTPDCGIVTCQTPAATLMSACSNKLNNGSGCCIPLGGTTPNELSESRSGGIEEIQLTFDQELCEDSFTLGGSAVTIEETTSALYPAWQAWSGGSAMTTGGSGNTLTLTFSPALADHTTYRINITSAVTTIAGQSIDVRGLVADVNDDGVVNGLDRSSVVGLWTGGGYACDVDVTGDGVVNATDRSAVVASWTSGTNTAP